MIDCTIDGHTALVSLKRPPVNAFNIESLAAPESLITQPNANAEVRAIVITGDGKFFSAGADLKEIANSDPNHPRLVAQHFGRASEALQNARPVVIAAINGFALGGGLECALSCDIRIAEAHVQMALPENAVGLLPAGCGTQTLPALVGEAWAKRMILCNERVDAETALRIGLVEELVPTGTGLETAIALAQRASSVSPAAAAASKKLIHLAREGAPRKAALAVEREQFLCLFDGEDAKEGVGAFLEKRPPRWTTR